jgi:hypothetical protein
MAFETAWPCAIFPLTKLVALSLMKKIHLSSAVTQASFSAAAEIGEE